jgi:DNA helicase HerA-like ATPase
VNYAFSELVVAGRRDVVLPDGGIPLVDRAGAAYRLLELPQVRSCGDRDDVAGRVRTLTRALLPAVTGAHAGGEPLCLAWLRTGTSPDVHVLLAGGPTNRPRPAVGGPGRPGSGRQPATGDGGRLALPYPPGANGSRVAAPIGTLLRQLPYWVRCTGALEPPLEPEPDSRPETVFDDQISGLAGAPFGWFVLAEPIGLTVLRTTQERLSREVPRLRDGRAASETGRLATDRSEVAYRELARAETVGLWRLHLLAGADTAAGAVQLAGLLCAACDTGRLPYALRPGTTPDQLDAAWTATVVERADPGPTVTARPAPPASPFPATSDLVAMLARPPVLELPGIRVAPVSTFDVMPETGDATAGGTVPLGVVLDRDRTPLGPLAVPLSTINRHVFVCGATGSGKSQTVRSLLTELTTAGVPWLVIEPAKAEYARMAGRMPPGRDVLVVRPGRLDVAPAGLNPLEPEPGFPLQTHLDLVRALFLAAFEAQEPFPQVLSQALASCYERLGWDLATGEPLHRPEPPRYPTLGDLRVAALATVDQIGYGREVTDNVRGFIDVRLNSLRLGTTGRFFEGGHRLDVAALLHHNTVIELEDVGNDQDKAFVIGTVLVRLAERLRSRASAARPGSVALAHVTVLEEAHRLLRAAADHTPAAHAVELFAALLAEVRAYGEGVVVAEQIPCKISPDVVKNSALKIMHRLPARDDRDLVGATMNLDQQQSGYIVTLRPGTAAVFTDGMDHAVLVQMPDREADDDATRAHPDAPLRGRRSVACGTYCQQRPCTTREITHARRLARGPELALWIELLAASHVIGQPEPVPSDSWLEQLRQSTDKRLIDCAIGQHAHDAVDRRYPELVATYQPETLATHLADRIRTWLRGDAARTPPCDGEVEWQAGPYRWVDVLRALRREDHPPDQPHPDSQHWRLRGLDLPDLPATTQLAALRRHPDSLRPGDIAVNGTGDPAEHERLAALLSPLPDPRDRLNDATGFLAHPNHLLLRVLRFTTPPPNPANGAA